MNQNFIITIGLFILATISGMLGLGVAFSAIPFLGLFLPDLVHQVQPLSLLLNGVTALFAVLGFAKSGCRDSSDIPEEEWLLGFPGKHLDKITRNLEKLVEKAIPRVRAKAALQTLAGCDWQQK